MNDYQDNPAKYMPDQTALGQAMIRAQEAERAANQAKADALAEATKEEALKAEIERATELSVRNNAQLQAQRMGISTNRTTTSQSAGAVPPMAEVKRTSVKVFGNMEVSYQQAEDMLEVGQITQAEFNKAVVDGLAARGYAAPKSFR